MAKKRAQPATEEFRSMWPGDRVAFRCNSCATDFELRYEPHAPEAPVQESRHCPFCGEQGLEYE